MDTRKTYRMKTEYMYIDYRYTRYLCFPAIFDKMKYYT